jgi:type IV pilus assembly protein PilM
MFKLLGQKKSFGIDIGTQTIKIAELSYNSNKFYIENYSIWDDDLDNVIQEKDGEIFLSNENIVNIMQAMNLNSEMAISEAYVALPSYLALFAVIQLPILDGKDLVTAVPLEAKKHIPVPLNTVQLDWINLGKNKSQDMYNILIIAIPNAVADKYVKISQALGIKIKGFELDCFSTLRTIELPKQNVCLIDIGARTSTVMIVNSNKKLQTIQSYDFGGNHITESIKQLKMCSTIEAENLKKHNGLSGNDIGVSEIIQSKIDAFIITDVVRLLNNINDTMNISINHIVVLGGGAKMSGIIEYIESIFHDKLNNNSINVSLATPIPNLFVKNIQNDDFRLNVWRDLFLSIGVALRNYIE